VKYILYVAMEISLPHDLIHRKMRAYLSEKLARIDPTKWSYTNMLYIKPHLHHHVDSLAQQAAFWYADGNMHVCECCKRHYIYALPELEAYLQSDACRTVADQIAWEIAQEYLRMRAT